MCAVGLSSPTADARALRYPCGQSLGLESVREYEDKVLREAKEQERRLQELKAHQAKLKSQLQFEQTKNLPAAIKKLQDSIVRAPRDAKVVRCLGVLEGPAPRDWRPATRRDISPCCARDPHMHQEKDEKDLETLAAKQKEAERSMEGLKTGVTEKEKEVETTKAAQEAKTAELKGLKKQRGGPRIPTGRAAERQLSRPPSGKRKLPLTWRWRAVALMLLARAH